MKAQEFICTCGNDLRTNAMLSGTYWERWNPDTGICHKTNREPDRVLCPECMEEVSEAISWHLQNGDFPKD